VLQCIHEEESLKTALSSAFKHLVFSSATISAGWHKVAKIRRAMQRADSIEAKKASSLLPPSGVDRCADCLVLIPQDWLLRF